LCSLPAAARCSMRCCGCGRLHGAGGAWGAQGARPRVGGWMRGGAMGLLANLRFAPQRGRNRGARPCSHLDQIRDVTPSSAGCQPCLDLGDTWVHLRMCMTDGQVLCCDSSKNKHARKLTRPRARPHPPDRPLHRAGRGLAVVLHRPDRVASSASTCSRRPGHRDPAARAQREEGISSQPRRQESGHTARRVC
jgi:hypothetical protein